MNKKKIVFNKTDAALDSLIPMKHGCGHKYRIQHEH